MDNSVVSIAAASNGRNYGREKETIGQFLYVYADGSDIRTGVTVRVYMGRSRGASKVYATVWAHGGGVELSGSGSAGGGGYHKASAAVAAAFDSAGVKLAHDIDGRGDSAIRGAVHALAKAMGLPNGKVLEV